MAEDATVRFAHAKSIREACRIIKEQREAFEASSKALEGLWDEMMRPEVVIARIAESDEPLSAAVHAIELIRGLTDLPGDES